MSPSCPQYVRFHQPQVTMSTHLQISIFFYLICLFSDNCNTYETNPIIFTSTATDDDTLSRTEMLSIIGDNG